MPLFGYSKAQIQQMIDASVATLKEQLTHYVEEERAARFNADAALNGRVTNLEGTPSPTPTPDPIPVSPPVNGIDTFELDIPAKSFMPEVSTAVTSGMVQEPGGYFSNWGQPGEAVIIALHADTNTNATIIFDYVLARETEDPTVLIASMRNVIVGDRSVPVSFASTCDHWTAPRRDWSVPLTLQLIPGTTMLVIAIAADSPPWTNWLDFYGAKITSDHPVTLS
jgi:hypothetical protein